MRRRLATAASALSLLLFVAAIALWARSYRVSDEISWEQRGWIAEAQVRRGQVRIQSLAFADDYPFQTGFSHSATPAAGGAMSLRWNFLGFGYSSMNDIFQSPPARGGYFLIPCWFITLLCAAFPAYRVGAGTHSIHRGGCSLCASCGYDLRASPDRCPECGRPEL